MSVIYLYSKPGRYVLQLRIYNILYFLEAENGYGFKVITLVLYCLLPCGSPLSDLLHSLFSSHLISTQLISSSVSPSWFNTTLHTTYHCTTYMIFLLELRQKLGQQINRVVIYLSSGTRRYWSIRALQLLSKVQSFGIAHILRSNFILVIHLIFIYKLLF